MSYKLSAIRGRSQMAKSMTLIVKAHALSHLTPTPYQQIIYEPD